MDDLLRARGVALQVVDSSECVRLMSEFIQAHPELWNEDIGETDRPSSAAAPAR